jgi:hypothetical protein
VVRESLAERPMRPDVAELRSLFISLEASLRNHIELEERLLMPVLDDAVQAPFERPTASLGL